MLPDIGTLSFVNADNVLIGKDNLVINTIFELLSSRAIQNISDMLSLVVLEFSAVKIDTMAKSSNTVVDVIL